MEPAAAPAISPTDNTTDPVELLRRSEWRYYFRRFWIIPVLAFGLAWSDLELYFFIRAWTYAPFLNKLHNIGPDNYFWLAGETFVPILFWIPLWITGAASWWALHRETRSPRARDLAVASVSADLLFRAKFAPLATYFVSVGVLYRLLADVHTQYYNPFSDHDLPLIRFVENELTRLLRAAGSAVVLPLLFWGTRLLIPSSWTAAILAAGIAAAGLHTAGVFAWIYIPGDVPVFIVGEVALAAVLARFVSRRFRELLVRE